MRRILLIAFAALLPLTSSPLAARDVVTASDPENLTITVYRDPNRYEGQVMERRWPRGFAMISETRTVTLPAGESTIRFDGVAEGMVAVSAIVTGLPGGTIEKNRNADLLSPASLVDGTLGNRVQITRTNPATGIAASEDAVIRTRADGGLVLQTAQGYEAVRCSGLPEKLTFDRVPEGLSADPVYSIDTRDASGGTYQIVLTYLAWGFDWEANYVATLNETGVQGEVGLKLMSWLTVLNDNGQSFPNAELLAVAGTINVESNFEDLSDPPTARRLRLTCYPLGSTAAGTPIPQTYSAGPPPPAPVAMMMESMDDNIIVVAAQRRASKLQESPIAVIALEEQLGDLKLYRIPERMTVAAKGLKQVAFLNKQKVRGEFLYVAECSANDQFDDIEDVYDMEETQLLLTMKNEEERGLGAALPMGGMTLFEPGPAGPQLVAELDMRDYAVGQDIELELGESTQVFSECARLGESKPGKWEKMRTLLSNANDHPVKVRMVIGWPDEYDVRWSRQKVRVKDGSLIVELTVPANSTREYNWKIREKDS